MTTSWTPPDEVSRQQIQDASDTLLARPDVVVESREVVLRIRSLGLDWDVAGTLFSPTDPDDVTVGPDGRRVGVLLQHGGDVDHRAMTPHGDLLARKLGYRVFAMTMPGRYNLTDPSRDWPGDTINPDGTVRTPLWAVDDPITPDQYDLVEDRSDPAKRAKWGTLFFLAARPGTRFHHRMASWPVAFDDAVAEVCRRFFPADEYSVYTHGHSTGGPFAHLALQRVENAVGLLGMETSPFGSVYSRMLGMSWDHPFTHLTIRTWRHIAKYVGAESDPQEIRRLPWLMEDVFDAWAKARTSPQFKAEYVVSYGSVPALTAAARATAARLGLDADATATLVARYCGYAAPLEGPDARPLPPLLYGITAGSRDHTRERYEDVLLPALAALDRPPLARVVRFDGGVHGYAEPEPGLPLGLLPAVCALWDEAIGSGYYLR